MNQKLLYLILPLLGAVVSAIFVTPIAYFNGVAAGRDEAVVALNSQLEQIDREKARLEAQAKDSKALIEQANAKIEEKTKYAVELADINGKLNLEVDELSLALGQCKSTLLTTEVKTIETAEPVAEVSATPATTANTMSPVN
mgnify:CR=1 FL=1